MSKGKPRSGQEQPEKPNAARTGRPSAVVDTRVVYCGDNLEQLAKLPDHCIDLIYIDQPFNDSLSSHPFCFDEERR